MTQFDDMGVQALPLFEVPGIGQGLEEDREGVVIGKNGAFIHVGVNRERDVRGVGMSKDSDEGIAGEDMGFPELG